MKKLPDVTLVMVTSLDRDTSVKVLRHCKKLISFGAVKLLTDMTFSKPPKGIDEVPIYKITSLPPKEVGFRFALSNGDTEEKTWGASDQGQFGFHGSMPHMAEGLKARSRKLYEEDLKNRVMRTGEVVVYEKRNTP